MTNPTRPTPAPGDPSAFLARLAAMERRIAELEANQPGYGNLSAGSRGNQMRIPRYLRDLYDTELWNVADGEVPVWDTATGKWIPGAAGGGVLACAWQGVASDGSVGNNTEEVMASWTKLWGDDVIAPDPINGPGYLAVDRDCYAWMSAEALWPSNSSGVRGLYIRTTGLGNYTVGDERATNATRPQVRQGTPMLTEHFQESFFARLIQVSVGNWASGVSLNPTVRFFFACWPL